MKNHSVLLVCLLITFSCQRINTKQTLEDTTVLQQHIHAALDTARNTDNFGLFDQLLNSHNDNTGVIIGSVLADSCRVAGNSLMGSDPKKARHFYNKGLDFAKKSLRDTHLTRLILYHNIGSTYFNENNYLKAVDYYDTVNTVIARYRLDTIHRFDRLRFNNTYETARTHLENGELGLSGIFMDDAYHIAQATSVDNEKLARLLMNYASFLRQKNLFVQAEKMALEGLSVANQLSESRKVILIPQLYMSLGNIMHNWKRFSEAEKYFLAAIQLFKKNEDTANTLRCFMNLGETLRQNGKLAEADKVLSAQLTLLSNRSSMNSMRQVGQDIDKDDIIGLYINRGEARFDMRQYAAARQDYQKALEHMQFVPIMDNDDKVVFPNLESFQGNRFYLLMVLNDLALLHIQNNKQNKALAVYDVLSQLTNLIRRDFIGEDEKMSVSGKTRDIMEKAVSVCVNLYQKYYDVRYIQQAFNFSEQSKAMTLLENARLRISADLPDSIKQQLSIIKNDISDVVGKLAQEPSNLEYLNQKKQLETDKRAIWQKVSQSLKYDGSTFLTFEQVQQHLLSDNQALIEYFIEKNTGKLHTFVIRKNDSLYHTVTRIDTTFERNIDSVYQYVTQRNNTQQADFCQRSYDLYKILIEPIRKKLPQRLLIIPEYPLSMIPFEALVTYPHIHTYDTARLHKSYLLFHHAVTYNYSANLHYLMAHDSMKKATELLKLVAFAPSFATSIRTKLFSGQTPVELNPINNKINDAEVQTMAQYVNTKLYTDKAATKARLLAAFKEHTAVHISTHGILSDDAKLSFISLTQNTSDFNTKEILTLNELFGQSLSHIKLVFLSACETGVSEKEDYKGEGMISMAWGLASAGVKSFVTTLWSVDAEATSELTPHFYNNLKDESNALKDIALTKAKIHYMDTHDKGKSNPFFWAGFMLVGDTEGGYFASPTKAEASKLPALLGTIGLLLLGWWWLTGNRKVKQ